MRLLAIGLALAGLAGIAQAQDDPGSAVSGTDDSNPPQPTYYLLEVYGYAPAVPRGSPELFRRAESAAPIEALFKRSDRLIASRLADPAQPETYAPLVINVDTAGEIAGCTYRGIAEARADEAALLADACAHIAGRMRFLPALDMAGNRVPDTYYLNLSFEKLLASGDDLWGRVEAGEVPKAIVFNPPLPMLAPAARSLRWREAWPPLAWGPDWVKHPSFAAPVFAGIASAGITAEEPVVPVVITPVGTEGAQCAEVGPTPPPVPGSLQPDPCDYVLSVLQPRWSAPVSIAIEYPLLLVGEGDGTRAVAPNDSVAFASLSGSAAQHAANLVQRGLQPGDRLESLALRMTVAPDGTITGCRIAQSAGSDAGDIAACRTMYYEVRAEPGRDVFGRPLPESRFTWTAPKTE